MDPFLTVPDMVKRYRGAISTQTLANWRSEGRGPAFHRMGGRILYALKDVMEWEASRRKTRPTAMGRDFMAAAAAR